MTERRSALDNALDLLVYAPVGFALTAAEEIPKLAAKGRAQVEGQMTVARMVGQFAVAQGRKEIEKRLGMNARPPAARGEAQTAPASASNGAESHVPSGNGSQERPSGMPQAGARVEASAPSGGAVIDVDFGSARPEAPARSSARSGPGAEGLAIPGYDSLSASQVVQRLAGLSQDELAAVGEYEAAHRGRRTILTRVGQLKG